MPRKPFSVTRKSFSHSPSPNGPTTLGRHSGTPSCSFLPSCTAFPIGGSSSADSATTFFTPSSGHPNKPQLRHPDKGSFLYAGGQIPESSLRHIYDARHLI